MASIYFPKNNIASSLSYNYLFDSYIIFPSLFISTKVWWRFPNFCVGLLDQVVHVCYTYGEIFKINLECCLKLDYTILTSLFLTHLLVNLCRIKARKKRLPFYYIWKTWWCPAPPSPTTLDLYLAASNFDCPAFFSHLVRCRQGRGRLLHHGVSGSHSVPSPAPPHDSDVLIMCCFCPPSIAREKICRCFGPVPHKSKR